MSDPIEQYKKYWLDAVSNLPAETQEDLVLLKARRSGMTKGQGFIGQIQQHPMMPGDVFDRDKIQQQRNAMGDVSHNNIYLYKIRSPDYIPRLTRHEVYDNRSFDSYVANIVLNNNDIYIKKVHTVFHVKDGDMDNIKLVSPFEVQNDGYTIFKLDSEEWIGKATSGIMINAGLYSPELSSYRHGERPIQWREQDSYRKNYIDPSYNDYKNRVLGINVNESPPAKSGNLIYHPEISEPALEDYLEKSNGKFDKVMAIMQAALWKTKRRNDIRRHG